LEAKFIEIRDRLTFIPALALRLGSQNEAEDYLLARSGYRVSQPEKDGPVLVLQLQTCKAKSDPYDWGDRTMGSAHVYIVDNWERLQSGAVVDVEFILGESDAPVIADRFSTWV
jgi:hypothetical protein